MYQLGVTTTESFRDQPTDSDRRVSLELIEQLEPIEGHRYDTIVQNLYGGTPAGRNVMKTYLGRYADAGDFTVDAILDCHDAGGEITLHDMAVSNGVTSLELHDQLAERAPVSMLATDKYIKCEVVTTPAGRWRVIFNADRRALQYIGYGFVLSSVRERRRYPVNRALKLLVERRIVPSLLADLEAGRIPPDRIREICLFHPSARDRAANDPQFRLGEHDITETAVSRTDIVRLMSVVHAFPEDLRAHILGKVAVSVREGGLLILGDRRDNQPTNMTVYRRHKDRVVPIRHFELPYLFHETVCALRLPEE